MSFDPIAYINTPRWQQQRLGLERIAALMEKLGDPQAQLRFVHVAGTNGKGSVCAYMAQVLQTVGYKTGLFTSPYIERFEERIRINGMNIPMADLYGVTLDVRDAADELEREIGEHPTEFELMTAVALLYFARERCDVAVVEVGLGGRLDSTNVIVPDVSVITRIGLDHTDILGDTLPQIAHEKAGIIKQGVPVVAYPQASDVMRVIEQACVERSCQLYLPDFESVKVGALSAGGLRRFRYRGVPYETQLLATYQPYNAALAMAAISVLAERGYEVTPQDVETGIRDTKWPGRFEAIGSDPLFIVDGAHNPQGAHELRASLEDLMRNLRAEGERSGFDAVFIVGVLADKDYRGMLNAVLHDECASGACDSGERSGSLFDNVTFITYTPDNPRALDAGRLAEAIRECAGPASSAVPGAGGKGLSAHPIKVRSCETPEEATELAIEMASSGNGRHERIIVAFGTLYAIGQIKGAYSSAGISRP